MGAAAGLIGGGDVMFARGLNGNPLQLMPTKDVIISLKGEQEIACVAISQNCTGNAIKVEGNLKCQPYSSSWLWSGNVDQYVEGQIGLSDGAYVQVGRWDGFWEVRICAGGSCDWSGLRRWEWWCFDNVWNEIL